MSVIDLRTFELAKTIAVGISPTGVAANRKKNEIYVANSGSNNVSVIDAEKNAVVATIGVHGRPYFIDVAEDGRRAYVANSGSANVSVIDLQKRAVLGNVRVGSAPGLARVSPDGATVVVSNRGDNTVSVIDVKLLRVRATLPVCQQPEDIAILPDSSKAFVACSGSSQVASIALATGKNTELTSDRVLALLDVGRTPVSLALKPDGGELMVCDFDSDSISIIETGNDEVGSSVLIGQHPARGMVTMDNSRLYVSNFGSDSVGLRHRHGPAYCHHACGKPSGWAGAVAGSEVSAGAGHAVGRCDGDSEAQSAKAGADGIFAADDDSGGRAAQWDCGEGVHGERSEDKVGSFRFAAEENRSKERLLGMTNIFLDSRPLSSATTFYTEAGLAQNLSRAALRSAAMAGASRDSMSRRGIM